MKPHYQMFKPVANYRSTDNGGYKPKLLIQKSNHCY